MGGVRKGGEGIYLKFEQFCGPTDRLIDRLTTEQPTDRQTEDILVYREVTLPKEWGKKYKKQNLNLNKCPMKRYPVEMNKSESICTVCKNIFIH